MKIKSITFSNFRNFQGKITIPFDSNITLLVGPNNVGKSNIFRLLGLFLEGRPAELDAELDFEIGAPKQVSLGVEFYRGVLDERLANRPRALARINASKVESFVADFGFHSGGIDPRSKIENFQDMLPRNYYDGSGDFISDFSRSSSAEENLDQLLGQLKLIEFLPKTAFVPSDRYIIQENKELPRFDARVVPTSSTLAMNHIVSQLENMDRPAGTAVERKAMKERKRILLEFIAHCIEAKEVNVEVPTGNQTVHITIDGAERPLSGVGAGIEQLLLMGMAVSQFKDKLVMIDEPEIHLHPRTQKLMMQYLAKTEGRFLIATHSSSVLDAVDANIICLENHNGVAVGRLIENKVDRFQAVKNLGHSASELVQANFVIWVEGPSDRIYLNHLIQKTVADGSLVEGVDYSIIMYGGSVLASHSFEDTSEDFFKALSISRQFSVYADSDKAEQNSPLKNRVERVKAETERAAGYIWISAGREIENYIPASVIEKLAQEFSGATTPADEFGKVLNDVDKVKFAKRAIEIWQDEWPLDLKPQVQELVNRIQAAR